MCVLFLVGFSKWKIRDSLAVRFGSVRFGSVQVFVERAPGAVPGASDPRSHQAAGFFPPPPQAALTMPSDEVVGLVLGFSWGLGGGRGGREPQ